MSPLLANVRLTGQDDFVNVQYAKGVMILDRTKFYKFLAYYRDSKHKIVLQIRLQFINHC